MTHSEGGRIIDEWSLQNFERSVRDQDGPVHLSRQAYVRLVTSIRLLIKQRDELLDRLLP